MKNDTMLLEQLRQEVPRRNLSPKATQRFEDTYRMLGVQQEAPVRRHRHKALWVAATAACLCCGMMFGVNAAFPAFAESLPWVGSFFEALNGNNFSAAASQKTAHGAFLDTYDVQDVNVTAGSADGTIELNISQGFSDGEMLSFTLDISLPQELADKYAYIGPHEDAMFSINGTAATPSSSIALNSQSNGHFSGVFTFPLSETLSDGDQISVDVSIPTLYGYPYTKDYETKGQIEDISGVDLQTSFTVNVDTSNNLNAAIDSDSSNGAQVQSIDVSPTRTLVTVSLPDWGRTDPRMYTMEGLDVRFNLEESYEQGKFRPASEETSQTCTLYFDGVPAGTDQVVLRFYQNIQEGEVLAEFTINLSDQTAVPSTTYQDGGVLDLDGPFLYYLISWAKEGEPFTSPDSGSMELTSVSYTKGKRFGIRVHTQDGYRQIEAAVYTADGTLLGTTVSKEEPPTGMGNGFYDENCYFWGNWGDIRQYSLYVIPDINYLPAWGETITVVITDSASGEELIRQDVQLNNRYVE